MNYLDLSFFKSDRSLIEAVDNLKFELKRDKSLKPNMFSEYRKGNKKHKYRKQQEFKLKVSNLEIEKKIETTRCFRRNKQ